MTDDVRERVERYVDANPQATVTEVLGTLKLDPAEHRTLVEDVLYDDDDRDEQDEDDVGELLLGGEESVEETADALRSYAEEGPVDESDDSAGGAADWMLPAEPEGDTDEPVDRDLFGLGIGYVDEDDDAEPWLDQWDVEPCSPPERDAEPIDPEARWAAFQDERYDAWLERDGPEAWGDPPGTGKTTNAARAAAHRDRAHVVLFDKHEKAREFQVDDATPDGYYHLKGAGQKREPHCMDADHADEECPDHGHPSQCPSMCPVYDRPKEDEIRQRYEALVQEVGPIRAHIIMDLHDGEECAWQNQYDGLADRERIVGVHEYAPLTSLQKHDRDVIWDEGASLLKRERSVDVEGLVRCANLLEDLSNLPTIPEQRAHNAREFATFAEDLVDVVTGDRDAGALEYPDCEYGTITDRRGTKLQYQIEREVPEEALAQLKIAYNRVVVGRMRENEWAGTPLCLDLLYALAAVDPAGESRVAPDVGLDHDAAMRAIAVPPLLERCPWCGSEIDHDHEQNALACTDDDCEWNDRDHFVTGPDAERARAMAWWEPTIGGELRFEQLPNASDLPERSLFLDATPVPEVLAGLLDVDEVPVTGDEPVDANMHVTQVVDGQYHASTIRTSEAAQERINQTIEQACAIHEEVLVIGQRDVKRLLALPENADWLHYHATRGLNREECDAVICVGAPHPDMWALERDASLLAMGRDDVRVGGEEHSTRRDESGELAANPPVYRKLHYEDDHGDGRAVPTKHYTGLTGRLFRSAREDELEQAIHRIRPVLHDGPEPKHVYLLTNVPTEVSVDTLATFDELTEPLRALLPVPDGAVDLLEYAHDVMQGDAPDGFRASQLVERDEDGLVCNKRGFHRLAQLHGQTVTYETVSNWVNALTELGLLEAGDYEQRRGVRFSAERATFESVLSVVSDNASFKVAAEGRLRRFFGETGATEDVLGWLREVFDLAGAGPEGGPPPDPT